MAGTGSGGYSGDSGWATNASLWAPAGVTIDASGSLFIADEDNDRIRKADAGGVITSVAGGGGSSGYNGAATNAGLRFPTSVKVDLSGNMFIAAYGANRVFKVEVNGMITILAGSGEPSRGTHGNIGDGGLATEAGLHGASGVAVDALGNIYIVDENQHRVRKVDSNGIITTVAGNGLPEYAGEGGLATNASLAYPTDVALDASGNLFICDSGNEAIRKVAVNGLITTVAGNGLLGYSGDGGPATNASLYYPGEWYVLLPQTCFPPHFFNSERASLSAAPTH